jgi:hypothetical protein
MRSRLLGLVALAGLPPVAVWLVMLLVHSSGVALAGESPATHSTHAGTTAAGASGSPLSGGATAPPQTGAGSAAVVRGTPVVPGVRPAGRRPRRKPVRPPAIAPAPGLLDAPATSGVSHPAPSTTPATRPTSSPAQRATTGARATTRSTGAAPRPTPPIAAPAHAHATPHMSRRLVAAGMRDPFVSLLAGAFEGGENTPVFDVGELRLVGVLWGQTDRFALVENGHGKGTALRAGDRLVNGYVESISPTALTLVQTSRRGTRRIVLHMKETENDGRLE